jgi:hypothetical protein
VITTARDGLSSEELADSGDVLIAAARFDGDCHRWQPREEGVAIHPLPA